MDASQNKRGCVFLTAPDTGKGDSYAELHATPLKTLAELMSWQQQPADCIARAAVNLAAQSSACHRQQQQCKLRTLVCHDMAGGYLDDRLVQGSHRADAYRFFNWLNVDIYVYFSHHFITIPPPCWIDSAHRHGVTVLGTFITEWQAGAELCKSLFSSPENATAAVKKMVEIATFYRFDGWLVNIENEVEAAHVATVLLFLRELKLQMRQTNPGSLVIWYDSITKSGHLSWQNELNAENSAYFDESDGIFLNYTWTEAHLRRSAAFGSQAGRQSDIFVGIDVFGRGMIGGGGFNTSEAVGLARKHRLPVALFAPGWVYEKHGSNDFTTNECRFWMLLKPFLSPNVFTCLPLSTSFCQGFGQKFHVNGKVAIGRPWTNVSLQHLQPLYHSAASQSSDSSSVEARHIAELCSDDAYNGGGCLRLSRAARPTAGGRSKKEVLQWRILDVSITSSEDVYVTCVYQNKCSTEVESCLCLELEAAEKTDASSDESKAQKIICSMADDKAPTYWLHELYTSADVVIRHELCEADVPLALKSGQMPAGLCQPWLQRIYCVEKTLLEQRVISGLLFAANVPDGCQTDFLIGQIQVVSASDLAGKLCEQPIDNLSVHMSRTTMSGGSPVMKVKLTWDHPSSHEHQSESSDVFCYHVWQIVDDRSANLASSGKQEEETTRWMLVGTTPSCQYTMQLDLASSMNTEFVDVAVQAVYTSGVCQERSVAARRRINLSSINLS